MLADHVTRNIQVVETFHVIHESDHVYLVIDDQIYFVASNIHPVEKVVHV